ncbi:unnamed protein product [Plutella xylostella]|uniref:(diamondback moth) hypothetical protein n=1 Tax=Plutella xylostella TaxID=51655 RepID=A0A8S4G8N6_PLUXY|nr:unnamed protein product [Plutella xylostella]
MPATLDEQEETMRKFRRIAHFPTVIGAIDCTHIRVKKINADGVLHPATPSEEQYNRCHIKTRNAVERCFGLWKQRFRCLLRGLYGNIETARMAIVACAVLHNIAIDMREDLFPGEEAPAAGEVL